MQLRALLLAALTVAGRVSADQSIEIPYHHFQLENGLNVIVHEDHKAPIVAVNVWYHVGSKNEREGNTGFAHLFEHLMFNGSEHWNAEYFEPFQRVGATEMNGTTDFDRTNYFQNVPTTALDLALWMESDRMGHLLGAIDQGKLDEQREVVKNEKRQGENQPYGRVFDVIVENIYPKGHPYSWMPIGSMEDLDAASLEDVREWFRTFYGPNNAVVVLAGDVDLATAREKVEKYFGSIPPGPPLLRREVWVAKRDDSRRARMQDRVPQARLYKVWNVPEWGSETADHLSLIADLLAGGKNSRLYERLVYRDQIATDVGASPYFGEIAGAFLVWATAQPGGELAAVEAAMDEELARFLEAGPRGGEVERVKTEFRAGFVRGVERVGGFGGKSDILAESMVYGGRPDFYQFTLRRVEAATPRALRQAARDWLGRGEFVLEVHPFPSELRAIASEVDRSGPPYPERFPAPDFPAITRATLANGLGVVVAERHSVPLVEFDLLLDAGYAADQFGLPGTASLAMNMLDEGAGKRSALAISERLALLGAQLETGSNLDNSFVSLSALTANLAASLEIYADVILDPLFPQEEFERLRRQQLAAIQSEKVSPVSMALRVFPALLYGEGHAYALPLTGSGTETSVHSLARQHLVEFHRTWFKPNNATLIVVGDTTVEEIAPLLEQRFAGWAPGEVPRKNIGRVELRETSAVYLIDRPGSEQSIIFAGHVAPPRANPNEVAIEAVNEVLGASFTSRINMNLREDKRWSYGARSVLVDAEGQRPFLVYAPVQTDKTGESMVEIQKEIDAIVGERPPTPDEVEVVKRRNTLTLPGRWETARAIAGSLAEIVRFGLADDYWRGYPAEVRALEVATVTEAADELLHPANLVWVVVGDRTRIERGIRELGFGEIRLIDADGNPLD